MNQPRVYKNSPAALIVIVLVFVMLIGIITFASGDEGIFFILPMALFALLIFGSVFMMVSAKTTISEQEISTQNILGTRTLRWSEIHRVSGRGYEIKLHNYDGDVTVHPSSSLPGYEEVVEFIGAKRPDLFNPLELGEIRRGWLPFISMAVVLIFLLGMGFVLFLVFLNTSNASLSMLLPLGVFGVIALVLASTTLSIPREISLDGNSLNVKYLFREISIRREEVSHVQFWYTQSRNGKFYYIALHQPNGKHIRLSALGVSLPIVYLTLKNWHAGHLHGRSVNSQQGHIAPNWSDNSWK